MQTNVNDSLFARISVTDVFTKIFYDISCNV